MRWTPIKKPIDSWGTPPNLLDYAQTCSAFSWDDVRRELDGLPGGGGLNIAHEAVDRHAAGPLRNHPALRWLGSGGDVQEFTYAELKALSN
ncbi:MAG: acetate--CoA ligase, partial [Desulfobacterales bacterium]